MVRSEGGNGVRRLTLGSFWVASLALAGWLGSHFGGGSNLCRDVRSQPGENHQRSEPNTVYVTTPVAVSEGNLAAAEVRQIIRDELARQQRDADLASADPPEEARTNDEAAEYAALQAKSNEASQFVERAIGRGRWSNDDRTQFARLTSDLAPNTVFELRRQVDVAINRDQLTIVDGFPPFGPPN